MPGTAPRGGQIPHGNVESYKKYISGIFRIYPRNKKNKYYPDYMVYLSYNFLILKIQYTFDIPPIYSKYISVGYILNIPQIYFLLKKFYDYPENKSPIYASENTLLQVGIEPRSFGWKSMTLTITPF